MKREYRGYAICGHGRTGSNFLCEALSETGLLGHPKEYFHTGAMRFEGAPDYPDNANAQIERILTDGMTSNGVYGTKIFVPHFEQLNGFDWVAALPNLSFIHLERHDLLGQAISYVRAEQSGQWRSTQPLVLAPTYDAGRIRSAMIRYVKNQARWRVFFARNGINPLRLAYEDIVSDMPSALSQIANMARVQLPKLVVAEDLQTRVQRDELTTEWRERFLAEQSESSLLDDLNVPVSMQFLTGYHRLRSWYTRLRYTKIGPTNLYL